ncbi:MAG: ATP-dependent RecD-like DNA helicase [Eubacteriales bacterium]|nr:ATP-dependent RecD-like DNA helicase [Eubacteriales bacterium]
MDYESVKQVEGFVENIIYRNEDNGYTVFNIIYKGEEVTCVGVLSYINAGEFIAAEGEFVKHTVYYMQFSIKSYEFRVPSDAKSVRRYLGSGAVKGIGEKMAERIVAAFGDDTFRIMEEEPERLAEIKGISMTKAMDIATQLTDQSDMRKAMMFLQNYGISMSLSNKIYAQYGPSIYTIIRQNPYKLADDIEGIGFKIADDIAAKVGIKVDSDFRIRSGIFYVLTQAAANGHVYLPQEELTESVKALLLIDINDIEKFITDLAIENKVVVKKDASGRNCVYAAIYYYMELNIAGMLKSLDVKYDTEDAQIDERIRKIEHNTEILLDDIQKEAVKKAVLNGLVVITGGPGTGKTTTINTIIKYFELSGLDIRLAAPTGRAAKRMTEACGFEAQTIHRLLEISGAPIEESGKRGTSASGMHFERNDENPLDTDVIIVDEMSMVDVNIMSALLKAVAVGTRLILVGDIDQLPSVGPGNVLKDIIASDCFPVVKLEKIFRQAAESEIVTNAHKINRGETVVLNKYSKDFLFVRRAGAEAIIAAMKTLVRDKLPDYVKADISELQILTPSRKSAVGVERLNNVMQDFLNPVSPKKMEKRHGDTIFREGDKVMQIKNDYQLEWEKRGGYGIAYEQGSGVFNGDTGVVDSISTFDEALVVKFEDERYVKYDFKQLDELELAYAITVHKSQGSEYPAVIIPMFQGPKMLMNRNILYTAVTRAKKCVCMVGDEEIFHYMAGNEAEQRRYSSLKQRIQEVCGRELDE